MSVLSLVPEDKRKDQKNSLESVYSSNSRLNLLQKRKRYNPLAVDMSGHSLGRAGDRYVTQRVLSAKTHRVKQLQNQLADAHYHLQELSNENRILRALQKKQEIALQRYENSNAELPTVLNSHSEEMRVQQQKYKQLKQQYKEATQKLKDRDFQYQQLKDEHQHLLDLSKDRNLLDREKLQAQVVDLTTKVQQQNETISMLQRRITLEAKNFKHQLQNEINKHKDTRHDLDLAITNADKLSTIIEMKEKMLSTAASRNLKSPTKNMSNTNISRTIGKTTKEAMIIRGNEERNVQMDQNILAKLCENSRNLSSALSHEEDTSSSTEPRSRYIRSRTNSTSTRSTPNPTRKSSKGSDEIMELAKTVQNGMADLAIVDDQIDFKNSSPDEVQKKIESLKADLLNKIKNNEEPTSRKSSALRRRSTEESIDEQVEEMVEVERPKSRGKGRSSNVSFYDDTSAQESSHTNGYSTSDDVDKMKIKRENTVIERKLSGRPIEKYCKDIIVDIEKSSKVIDVHMKQFSQSKFDGHKLVQQLHAVDKFNELLSTNVDIPAEALSELNNNFKLLTDQVTEAVPLARKRSVSGRRNSRIESKTDLLGDSTMSNQDLLDDLLGKK